MKYNKFLIGTFVLILSMMITSVVQAYCVVSTSSDDNSAGSLRHKIETTYNNLGVDSNCSTPAGEKNVGTVSGTSESFEQGVIFDEGIMSAIPSKITLQNPIIFNNQYKNIVVGNFSSNAVNDSHSEINYNNAYKTAITTWSTNPDNANLNKYLVIDAREGSFDDGDLPFTCNASTSKAYMRNIVLLTKKVSKQKLMSESTCIHDAGFFFVCGKNYNPNVAPGQTGWCGDVDADGDGYCGVGAVCPDTDSNNDGKPDLQPGDCNDDDPTVNPGASEICGNGKDDDCNESTSDECVGSEDPDADNDGYCDVSKECPATDADGDGNPDLKPGDCNDNNSGVHPGATEIPGNGVDEDCDNADGSCELNATPEQVTLVQGGSYDYTVKYQTFGGYNGSAKVYVKGLQATMQAADGIQIAKGQQKNIKVSTVESTPVGTYHLKFSTNSNDVVSQASSRFIGNFTFNALSLKNLRIASLRQDLSGVNFGNIQTITGNGIGNAGNPNLGRTTELVKATCSDEVILVVKEAGNDGETDDDGDGYCEDANGNGVCDNDPESHPGDCNDDDASIHPNATEVCGDSKDNNCNGLVDENCGDNDPEADNDGDGYCEDGNGNGVCDNDPGKLPGDCDDTNPAIHPGAEEVCDGRDNNCDGGIDNLDNDQDGYYACEGATDPTGGSPNGGHGGDVDCNDSNAAIHPGATELCADNIDQDCDGLIDEGCSGNPNVDDDGDGYCEATSCSDGSQPGDCDDTDASVHPGATEICSDNKDNDCDGLSDSFDPACAISPSEPGSVGWGANLEGGAGCSLQQSTQSTSFGLSLIVAGSLISWLFLRKKEESEL